jgi:hypothetical protein
VNTVGNYPALEAGTADWVSPFKHRAVAAASIQGSLTTASKSVGLAIVADRLIWISLRAAEAITGMTVRTRRTAVGRPLAGNFNQQSADAENYTSSQFTNADDLRKTLDPHHALLSQLAMRPTCRSIHSYVGVGGLRCHSNAIFVATGKRLRKMPVDAGALIEA